MTSTSEQTLWIHGYFVEPADSSITGPRGKLQVHPAAMSLLLHLVNQNNQYVDNQDLTAYLNHEHGPGPRNLENLILELRICFDDLRNKPLFIQQSDEKGYRLVAPAVPAKEQGDQPVVGQVAHSADEPQQGDRTADPKQRSNSDESNGETQSEQIGWFESLKRRRVFRVMASYAVGAWLLLQITDVLASAFPVPDWTAAAVATSLAVGFPIVAFLAWLLQRTPSGIVIDGGADGPTPVDRARVVHFLDLLIIGVLLVVVAVLSYGRFSPSLQQGEHTKIAVLPFQNLSGETDGFYLSEGLSDDIRTRLYAIPQLLIAAKISTNALANKGLDIKTIGERLTVEHVLDGSVRRVGNQLRIAVALIDVADGFNRWSKTYDTTIENMLEVQNNISLFVASELEVLLTKELRETLAKDPTKNPTAYDAYLQARSYLNRPRSTENLDQALILFRKAIDYDPSFALGFAGLCQAFIGRHKSTSDTAFIAAAEINCQRALELDSKLEMVHVALGQLYISVGRLEESAQSFENALKIDNKSIGALAGLGYLKNKSGEYEQAEAYYRKIIDMRPGYFIGYSQLARFLLSRRRLPEAIENYNRVIAFTPDNAHAYNNLGTAYYLMGDFERAAEAYRHSLELKPGRAAYSNTGTMLYYAGNYDAAAQMFKKAAEEAVSDYRLWGNLADAQRFITGMTDQAHENYLKAIKLAKSQLETNPNDSATQINLAFYYANTGDIDTAKQLMVDLKDDAQQDAEQEYIKALIYAMLGDVENLNKSLMAARSLGFLQSTIDATPEFTRRTMINTQTNTHNYGRQRYE